MPEYALNKTTFLAGAQCHKRLWWQVHEPDALELAVSVGGRYRVDEGREVGTYAQRYVPGGVAVERGGRSVAAILADSVRAVASGASAVYEAGFVARDTLVYADILERVEGGWALIEVKSTTSLADEHLMDVAVQAWVLREAGVPVVRCEVMHLNRACAYPDLSDLFAREDVTGRIAALLEGIGAQIPEMLAALAGACPPKEVGDHCYAPDDCPFLKRCWPDKPPHHVSTLYMVRRKKAAEWEGQGWTTIDKLPDAVKLGTIPERQRRAVRTGAMIVERAQLVEALATLRRPVAHIDFETIQPAIPLWDGCHPFDQIPVQMSCHLVAADGTVSHAEWLAEGAGDPRPAIARAIVKACSTAPTVTAYYASFEKACIELLASACPECADALRAIAARIVDLLPLVRDHVYHPDFGGSFSLKQVLPALVPELGYEGLVIAEGETASAELSRLMFRAAAIDPDERRALREALLEYCKRDTEAMVALADRLTQLAV